MWIKIGNEEGVSELENQNLRYVIVPVTRHRRRVPTQIMLNWFLIVEFMIRYAVTIVAIGAVTSNANYNEAIFDCRISIAVERELHVP